MINCHLFVCSLGAVIDQRTNNLSLFSILEQIQAAAFPLVLPKLYIVAAATKDKGDLDPQTALRVTQGDQEIINVSFQLNFQEATRTRSVVEIVGLMVSRPGTIEFTLKTPNSVLKTYSIEVSHLKKPLVESVKVDAKPLASTPETP